MEFVDGKLLRTVRVGTGPPSSSYIRNVGGYLATATGNRLARDVRLARQTSLDTAFTATPHRFKGQCRQPPELPTAVWIHSPEPRETPLFIPINTTRPAPKTKHSKI
ncbi:hypothetical protein OVY01_05765 [Robbsia sp. Bb-Pol-6]|uniref:Uncharacterized protein n=1 Tax=Robbsia betulipollinis TaxID=2981849 RepID=A0ABT3ZJP8_9BURK|nr:hypothetical protein [Robbsia betulipollinis]MCY0386751.1 hypothetical protein [Robbsia betulipollinis]